MPFVTLESILNTTYQQVTFSDSKDSPGIKRLLHNVFSKEHGINAENLPTNKHIAKIKESTFYQNRDFITIFTN